MRFLLLTLFLLPETATSATLAFWYADGIGQTAFFEVLQAHELGFRDDPGNPAPNVDVIVPYLVLLAVYTACLTRALPSSRFYAAFAARAMSRTRATIARNPFER